jgi:hypothetical protein
MKNKKRKFNQEISTRLGTIIIVFFAVMVGVFVWLAVKNREVVEVPQNIALQPKPVEKNQGQQGQNGQIISEAKDSHGCRNAAGFFWCEKKQSCVNNWNESCGISNLLDTSQWDEFNSKDHDSKFYFSFKYPNSWFNPFDTGGESSWTFPFYLKNDYINICKSSGNGALQCDHAGYIASVTTFAKEFIPRKVTYDNEQQSNIIADKYKGLITGGTVNDSAGGYIAKNGEEEMLAIFSNVKNSNFKFVMKISSNLDKKIFYQIISTLNFSK